MNSCRLVSHTLPCYSTARGQCSLKQAQLICISLQLLNFTKTLLGLEFGPYNKYNEYFAWRYKGHLKHFFVPLNVSNLMCRMVPWMNDDPVPFRTVQDSKMFQSCVHRQRRGPGMMTFDRWVPRE